MARRAACDFDDRLEVSFVVDDEEKRVPRFAVRFRVRETGVKVRVQDEKGGSWTRLAIPFDLYDRIQAIVAEQRGKLGVP